VSTVSVTVNQALAAPLVLLVRLYQRFISPMRPPTCRFYPSCSAYAVTALERFGPLRGGWLAARRLGRCHPWTAGGVDPVPMTWATRNDVRPEDYRPPDLDGDQHSDPPADPPIGERAGDRHDQHEHHTT
jgi:putative membrane protein insertion efficiency factor